MVSYANRGKLLENIIDQTNKQYMIDGVADVRKVPTPVKIISNKNGRVSGHVEKPTWVDYSGIFNGRAIIFDAKQTAQKSLPLANIHRQQYELLKSWHEKGARSFLVVNFSEYDKYYYLDFEVLRWAFERAESGGKKSISLKEFEDCALELKEEGHYKLNYLKWMG